jgi:hypothetical protein
MISIENEAGYWHILVATHTSISEKLGQIISFIGGDCS